MRTLILGFISFMIAAPTGKSPDVKILIQEHSPSRKMDTPSENPPDPIIKEFIPAGRIEALVNSNQIDSLILVQLDLKNDSLFALVNNIMPDLELFSGPASYHRIMSNQHLNTIQLVLTEDFYSILNNNYKLINMSREYWVDFKQGNETQGTWSDDGAIELTCSCLSGANDCVKLGWDDSWWNPLDYWGEAWYGYQPPLYQTVEEIRITIRGAQCDDLPLWSETYMGMMDDNGNWSHDYELSIDYTDNEYIVENAWSGGMLMPRIGSEDNYVIDYVKLEFYYSCNGAEDSPTNLLASDGSASSCTNIDLSWGLSPSETLGQRIYRDDQLIATLEADATSYQDWLAIPNAVHIYCIEAYNECGNSPQICNPGSLHMPPTMVENIMASDGLFDNQIVVTWNENDNTDTYRIYRDGIWLGVNNATQTEYIDQFIDLDIIYEYCVESINVCGDSDWACDSGFINIQPGDVNDDGTINVLDVVTMVNVILLLEDATEFIVWATDLNFDGITNILDVILLVNQILE